MQVPAPFGYDRATSVEDAIALLERRGPEARVVAGGHSLLPMMKLRILGPSALVDINDLTDLSVLAVEGDELRIGALVRHADLLASPLAAEHFAVLVDAERVIADPIVRNRGTVGGSLCQADPAEDLSAAFSALKAEVVARGPSGERRFPVRELHAGPYQTTLGPSELLTELRLPIRGGCASAYEKVERRVGDYAVAAAGAVLWMDDGVVSDAGIGLTGVGAEHFAAPRAEEALRGHPAGDEEIEAAAAIAAEECNPVSDQRGPDDYKRHLVGELTRRALRRAVARHNGEEA